MGAHVSELQKKGKKVTFVTSKQNKDYIKLSIHTVRSFNFVYFANNTRSQFVVELYT